MENSYFGCKACHEGTCREHNPDNNVYGQYKCDAVLAVEEENRQIDIRRAREEAQRKDDNFLGDFGRGMIALSNGLNFISRKITGHK